METQIFDKVVKIVSEYFEVDKIEIGRDTSFAKDLNADSLDMVEVVLKLEEEFDIRVPNKDAEKIMTVAEAVDYISSHNG